MDPADLLRAIRSARRLSQRELAQVAELPASTIERIESSAVRAPRWSSIEQILASTGYRLVVVDEYGQPVDLDGARFRAFTRDGRHLSAHLDSYEVRTMLDPWWGWRRVAFWDNHPLRPDRTYVLRRRDAGPPVWEDSYARS